MINIQCTKRTDEMKNSTLHDLLALGIDITRIFECMCMMYVNELIILIWIILLKMETGRLNGIYIGGSVDAP